MNRLLSTVPWEHANRAKRFRGDIYMYHPYRDEVAGVSCVNNLADLPVVPDLAFVSVPKEVVIDAIDEAGLDVVPMTEENRAAIQHPGHPCRYG